MAAVGQLATDSRVLEEFSLHLGRNEVVLGLSDSGISWTLKNKVKETPTSNIEWSDVLNVIPIPAGCKKPLGPGINLFYISRTKTNWRKEQIVIKTSDEQQAATIADKITKKVQEKAVNRPKSLLIFINPKSGGCKGVSIYEKVAPLFKLAAVRTEILVTERAGHTIDHLKQVDLSRFDGVVVVGGDGTLTECMSGLAQASCVKEGVDMNDPDLDLPHINLRVGLIPAGTGQGMIMLSTGSKNIEHSALNIIKGSSWPADLFTAHCGHQLLSACVLLVGYGVFSQMIKKSESNRQLGRIRYLYAMASTTFQPSPFFADIEILKAGENGNPPEWIKRSGEYINVGHFHMDYISLADHDGYLYVGLTKRCSMFSIYKLMFHLQTRKPVERVPDWLDYHRALCYKIKPYSGKAETKGAEPPLPAHTQLPYDNINLDGESVNLNGNEIQIKIQPKRVKLFGTHPHAPPCGMAETESGVEGATGTS